MDESIAHDGNSIIRNRNKPQGNVLLFSRAPKISDNFTAPFYLFDFSKSRTRQFFLA